jgi:hypothetical protein
MHSKQFLYKEKKKGKSGFEDQILNTNTIFVSKTGKSGSLQPQQISGH